MIVAVIGLVGRKDVQQEATFLVSKERDMYVTHLVVVSVAYGESPSTFRKV